MTNEIKNVPELRFKNESGKTYPDWEKRKLNEIADFQNGKAHESYVSETGNYILVNSKFISTEAQVKKYVSQQLTPLNKQDIAIVMSDIPNGKALAKCFLVEESNKYSLNQRIGRLYNILGDSRFVYAILNRNKQLLKYDSGVGQTNLKKSEIIEIIINWPVQDEQQKIGNFFSKLDRQIELEEQKLEKLEEQKKGYMQQIFSQQLRFKDENGNDYPGWKEYVLGETGNTYSGLSSKTKEDFGYGDSYFITYMNVFKNTIAKANMTEKVNIQENEKQNKVNYKDILFTTSSEVPEETGMSSIWLYKENNVYLNSFCFGFHVTCDDIEPIYLTRFLRSEKMRKQITILSQGSTRFNISKKEVMKLKIDVPNLEEQTKIVNFLSEYDSLIENQSSKIELLKERKQGFLQKMFV